MTLIIELTDSQEAQLKVLAEREGVPPDEFARRLVVGLLPTLTAEDSPQKDAQSLADFLGNFIGSLEGSDENIALDSQGEFADHLVKKRREGHL